MSPGPQPDAARERRRLRHPRPGHADLAGAASDFKVALDNGDLIDHAPYQSDHVRALNGRGLAILRASRPGALVVGAAGDGLPAVSTTLRVVPGRAPQAIQAAR